jgi:hypothetical protein
MESAWVAALRFNFGAGIIWRVSPILRIFWFFFHLSVSCYRNQLADAFTGKFRCTGALMRLFNHILCGLACYNAGISSELEYEFIWQKRIFVSARVRAVIIGIVL